MPRGRKGNSRGRKSSGGNSRGQQEQSEGFFHEIGKLNQGGKSRGR